MLIINNGVPKSGSTWIQRILVRGLRPDFPSEKWRNSWKNPSIDPRNLRAYIEGGEWQHSPTLIKMHFKLEENYDYIWNDNIKILVSYRNIPDSVVSWFHHKLRNGEVDLKHRAAWFEKEGRVFAKRALNHRLSWEKKPNTILLRYEDMLADATSGIESIFNFIGNEKTRAECVKIAESTQVTLKPGEPLRDGNHVRTAGRSVARDEIPEHLFNEFVQMEEQQSTWFESYRRVR